MSLTDDWRGGKLKCGYFFLRLLNDDITVGFFDGISFSCCHDFVIKEILAPCDYEELQSLKNEIANYQSVNDRLFAHNKSLRGLLKQCIPAAEFAKDLGLVAMLKNAIGDNGIQADPVADIKIQESEKK